MGIFRKKRDYDKYITIALIGILLGIIYEIYQSFGITQMGMKQWFMITLFGVISEILIILNLKE